ncbi:MAG: cyclic nucleotide-binding domain-containing protein [Bradymonadaceae bacterium]
MSSQKLRKYLAYYQKTLREDPGNIEARLRLASIFREMGRPGHAIEEYVAAAKLLASSGLPLEAIAACKAILELDSSHTETQFFLARLYAQVPEATGQLARVARPVDEGRTTRADEEPSQPAARVHALTAEDARNVKTGKERAITLHSPKAITDLVSPLGGPLNLPPLEELKLNEDSEEVDELVTSEMDAATRVVDAQSRDELVTTLDIAADDIIGEERAFRRSEEVTVNIGVHAGLDEPTGVMEDDFESDFENDLEQTFELGVFDLASLDLDHDEDQQWKTLSFLDELDEPDSAEVTVADRSSAHFVSHPSIQSVSRAQMPEIPLFSQLTPEAFMELLRVIDVRSVPEGTTIISPDDPTSSLFVIVKGRTRVTKLLSDGREVDLATLAEGEFFGEFRLLTGRDSMATVVADTDLELLEVRDEVLYQLAETNPEVWDALWNFYYARMLNNLLASSRMFNALGKEAREELAARFTLEEFIAGHAILEQGHPSPGIYLIVSGNVVVERSIGKKSTEIDVLQEGDFFGVTPSATDEPCSASICAVSDTIVLRLPGDEFRAMMRAHPIIAEEVHQIVRERLHRTGQYARATTPYAELGVIKKL